MCDEAMRHAAVVAADDQMRAEARDRLRKAPLFFASIVDNDGHRVLGSTRAPETAAFGFLLVTIASLWDWLAEMTGEGDAELVRRVLLILAERRDSVDADGGGADDY